MSRWIYRGVLAVVVAAAAFWAWQVLFPSPEKVIRKRLAEVARLATFGPNEAPLAKLSNSQKLLSHFASEVELKIDVPGRAQQTAVGTEELRQAVMAARSQLSGMSVDFVDIGVRVLPDAASAIVTTTVRANIYGERDSIVQEMKFRFEKTDGDWLIRRIEPVSTLK